MAKENEATLQLTKDDLAQIVATAIKAAKEPNVVEQRKLDEQNKQIEEAQASRLQTSEGVKQDIKNKRWIHANCSHAHANGDTHAAWVQEKSGPGYFLCQKNQCVIRPGSAPEGYRGTVIFSTDLFNTLFQKARSQEIFQ